MFGEFVFVDGAFARTLLGDEGVLDPQGEMEAAVVDPASMGGVHPGRFRHFNPVVATDSMNLRCTIRNMMASGSTAISEPAIMVP